LFRKSRKAERLEAICRAEALNESFQQQRERKSQSVQIMAHLFAKPPPEVVRGQAFDVGPRYCGLAYIGEGAYGMVW